MVIRCICARCVRLQWVSTVASDGTTLIHEVYEPPSRSGKVDEQMTQRNWLDQAESAATQLLDAPEATVRGWFDRFGTTGAFPDNR